MTIDLSKIYEGWRNLLIPPSELKEKIAIIREYRSSICRKCEFHSKHHKSLRMDAHCTKCSCTIAAKTSCLSCECADIPPRWPMVLTYEQELEIDKENEKFSGGIPENPS